MDIPALYAIGGAGEDPLRAVSLPLGRCLPGSTYGTVAFDSAASLLPHTTEREPVVVVDWDSISTRRFSERVLKKMRVRGRDIWFMTWIEGVDDVMDAFNTNAECVLAPLHGIDGREELEDINSVSDGVIPVVFVKDGRTSFNGRRMDPLSALGILESTGFYRMAILDSDGSLPGYDWETVLDLYPACIPFVRDRDAVRVHAFRNVIAPIGFL